MSMTSKCREHIPMMQHRPGVIASKFIVVVFLVVATGCVSQRAPVVASGGRQVHFELQAPEARSVALLGDFNGWAPPGLPLTGPDSAGYWRLMIVMPGSGRRFNYVYLVDDRDYRTDNLRPIAADDYGGRNNILYIP